MKTSMKTYMFLYMNALMINVDVKISLTNEEREIVELIDKHLEGLCIDEVAKKLDTTRLTAAKRLDFCKRVDLIRERKIGRVKLYYPKKEYGNTKI